MRDGCRHLSRARSSWIWIRRAELRSTTISFKLRFSSWTARRSHQGSCQRDRLTRCNSNEWMNEWQPPKSITNNAENKGCIERRLDTATPSSWNCAKPNIARPLEASYFHLATIPLSHPTVDADGYIVWNPIDLSTTTIREIEMIAVGEIKRNFCFQFVRRSRSEANQHKQFRCSCIRCCPGPGGHPSKPLTNR